MCACLAAAFLVDRAVTAGPIVIATAGAITVALPMAAAAIQAMGQLDSCQVIANLV